jgi:hypothetical protein
VRSERGEFSPAEAGEGGEQDQRAVAGADGGRPAASPWPPNGAYRGTIGALACAGRAELAIEVGRHVVRRAVTDEAVMRRRLRRAERPHEGADGLVVGVVLQPGHATVLDGRQIGQRTARSLEGRPDFNPVVAMAETLMAGYGLAGEAARLRAAQIVAAALGWRIFEACLVQAGGLEAVPLATLREELARSARRLGATPWPSPPDPQPARAEPASRPG